MATPSNEVEEYLFKALDWLRSKHHIRRGLALGLIGALLILAGKFAYDLYPRNYELSISGGGMLTKSHQLAKVLQDEAARRNITLTITPTAGSFEALNDLNSGTLDLAFVQGGIDPVGYDDVRQVASIAPQLIQFLVKGDVKNIHDIHGKTVNLGEKNGGPSIVSNQILRFSGLMPEVDYVETNFSDEQLLSMKPERLPDVVVQVSYAPSAIVDFLVQKRGYQLLEMSFPPSLALRMGWVADTKILAYMYQISPPIPATDIQVVGVNLNLLANKNVDPKAIAALLPVLYSPQVASRFNFTISEDKMLTPSGFPISDGTEAYIASKQPLITAAMISQIQNLFGLVMSLISVLLVIFKWFKAPEEVMAVTASEDDDDSDNQPPTPSADDSGSGVSDHINNIANTISKFT
ncbi:TAXI family TRAP transporter solute-binding subunit [Polynucleobacter sp. MWH-Svant-W18]|jgi:TRAP-type uncharacterized transport system substrate-binding protein|uniref:TAXI family TRAP transporter solute-binding subunit n=1 Tax=Polynucleobacter sp. MWH-Svant-W18 TaxID=1855909 RepID=UPI001BFCD6A9|nr:TAXI family TRAP transporter solute-binding subunit [Polynucleobacter sp. MWH-Svant-W18]QWD77345.1 hypothetical protein C2757_05455 [Polynucleobacter sp. MWH-Svant-W18]